MLESRHNRIRTLEPKKSLINNDIKIENYNIASVSTIIAVSTLFLISMKVVVLAGI